MKIRAILLLLIVFYDFSLHFVKFFDKVALHPLYPNFPLFGFISYSFFWMIYYGIATIFALTLLGSGTIVKTKTETNIYQDKAEIDRLNEELKNIKKENGVEK